MSETVTDIHKLMDYFEKNSKEFHSSFSVINGKLDDCVGTSSLCVKEEFFKQETNIKLFLNESKQCKPLGMIILIAKTKILCCIITFIFSIMFYRRYS